MDSAQKTIGMRVATSGNDDLAGAKRQFVVDYTY